MIDAVLALSKEYDMFPAGGMILCAVSGGADSMCLLHLLCSLAPSAGFTVAAAHYNHGLRGGESDADEAFVTGFCRQNRIPFFLGKGKVAEAAAASGMGLEATARALRYRFLEQTAKEQGAARIATAHTADDNLETFLLHLTRGTGLSGLCGIPPRRGQIVRPLLTVSRLQVEEYLLSHNIAHREDQSNLELRFSRNRIRHQVIPVLRSMNPNLNETSARMIASLRADNDYINAQALRAVTAAEKAWGGLMIRAAVLNNLPAALGARAIRFLLDRLQGAGRRNVTGAHYSAVLSLARCDDPSARVSLPNGIEVRRVYQSLLFTVGSPVAPAIEPIPLCLDGETLLPDAGWRIECRRKKPCADETNPQDTIALRADAIGACPVVRSRRPGDRLSLPGRGSRTLKRLFIDEKIPCFLRDNIPVLSDEDGVIAVYGFGPDRSRTPAGGEETVYVSFSRIPGGESPAKL